jgi:uncharacterized protein (DUF2062 family)
LFKRRTPKTYLRIAREAFWPSGGWWRSSMYVVHRLRRLPDPAHRVARGIFAGVFISFTPLFGLHFIGAAIIAWIIRGNILAALFGTFFGNPITLPLIATVSVELGIWLLGLPPVPLHKVISSFSHASVELWSNLTAIFTGDAANWSRLGEFFTYVFMPYLVGGIVPGIIAGIVCYYVSYWLVMSYQRGRIHRLKARFEKRRRAIEAARAEAAHHVPQEEGADAVRKDAKVTPAGLGPREAE